MTQSSRAKPVIGRDDVAVKPGLLEGNRWTPVRRRLGAAISLGEYTESPSSRTLPRSRSRFVDRRKRTTASIASGVKE